MQAAMLSAFARELLVNCSCKSVKSTLLDLGVVVVTVTVLAVVEESFVLLVLLVTFTFTYEHQKSLPYIGVH